MRQQKVIDFLNLAERWQEYTDRDIKSILLKLTEEIEEFMDSEKESEKLDELGDIVVNALRIIIKLNEEQNNFMYEASLMKVSQREVNGKDKKAEAILRNEILKKYSFK